MNTSFETLKFAYVSIAIITLISFVGKPPINKEKKSAMALILSTDELLLHYDYVIQAKNHLEKKLSEDFLHGPDEVFDEIEDLNVQPDYAALAIDLGVKYLKKNVSVTPDKIAVLEQAAARMRIPFKKELSLWIR